MKKTTLWLWVVLAIALTSLVVSTPTYAQQVTPDTSSSYLEWSKKRVNRGMKKWKVRLPQEFFEDQTDEQKQMMREELEELKDSVSKEEVQAMSEEEREWFMIEMYAQRQEIIEKYVDAEDRESGEYEAFVAEQESKKAERKANSDEEWKKWKRGSSHKWMKWKSMEKFISYIATMNDEQKSELLQKINDRVEAMTTRIEESDRSDEEKATVLERINQIVTMIREVL